jgi:hypothetical protein
VYLCSDRPKGRFYNEIVFYLTKTPKRIQSDRLIKTSAGNTKKIRDAKAKQRPALLDGDIDKVAQNTGYALDMADMERQFWAHWESKGKPDFNKGVAVAFKGFVDRKFQREKQRRR